jgi:hypothetical protein
MDRACGPWAPRLVDSWIAQQIRRSCETFAAFGSEVFRILFSLRNAPV